MKQHVQSAGNQFYEKIKLMKLLKTTQTAAVRHGQAQTDTGKDIIVKAKLTE